MVCVSIASAAAPSLAALRACSLVQHEVEVVNEVKR